MCAATAFSSSASVDFSNPASGSALATWLWKRAAPIPAAPKATPTTAANTTIWFLLMETAFQKSHQVRSSRDFSGNCSAEWHIEHHNRRSIAASTSLAPTLVLRQARKKTGVPQNHMILPRRR